MVSSAQCLAKYGAPSEHNACMTLWDVPGHLEVGIIPKRIYCNHDMILPLSNAFQSLIRTNAVKGLKTYDGCFNIRKKRGLNSPSLHSWGIAIDFNAFENGLGMRPKMSPDIVQCFKAAGFDWGGDWQRMDGMHFQLKTI